MSRAKTNPPQPAKAATQSAKIGKPTSWKERLEPQDYEELRLTFEAFDADGSGSIDPEEINKALEELGTEGRSPFVLTLIASLKDKNKELNLDEFIDAVASKIGELKSRDGLKRVFGLYDSDESGVIDFEKFKVIAKTLREDMGDEELIEMMHSTHINHKTGTEEYVTFEQFYSIVTKFNK